MYNSGNYVQLHNNQDLLRILDIMYRLCILWIHQTTDELDAQHPSWKLNAAGSDGQTTISSLVQYFSTRRKAALPTSNLHLSLSTSGK